MSNTFFTSDTHYGHSNIAGKKTSQWKDGYRNYNSIEEMNQDLVKNINKLVGPDDILYHLGDWSFGGKENIWNFRKQIACRNIHLILGNHDHHIESNRELSNVSWWEDPTINRDILIDESPDIMSFKLDVKAQELFSSVSHYKEVSINGQVYVLSHYPFAVWHGNGKNWRHLHGHSHGSFNSIGLSMDVGVDVALSRFKDPRPFSIQEIENYMKFKTPELLDHHSSETNTGKRPK